jgi:hypothetical protein
VLYWMLEKLFMTLAITYHFIVSFSIRSSRRIDLGYLTK